MIVGAKFKTVYNKIEQKKTQCNLDRQTAKILPLSSRNVSKYKLLTAEDLLPEKRLLQKAASIKRMQYSIFC